MRDNIRSFASAREKRVGSGNRREFFGTTDYPANRLEFRFSDGGRVSVPYVHILLCEYFLPEGPNEKNEIIFLDIPGQARLQISGLGLDKLFDLIMNGNVTYVREADKDEVRDGDELFVETLNYLMLFDVRLDYEILERRREEYLGSRLQSEKVESETE